MPLEPPDTISARNALREFGITGNTALTLLASAHNVVYRVDCDHSQFVLRLQSHKKLSKEASNLQLDWLHAIDGEASVIVPKPLRSTSGQWSIPEASNRDSEHVSWILLQWVEGDPINDARSFAATNVLETVGSVVAQLHKHSANFRPANLDAAPRIDAESIVGKTSCLGDGSARRLLSADDFSILTASATIVADALRKAGSFSSELGLIHADLGPGNWVFHQGGPRIIDFDEFGYGSFLFDLLGVLWSHASWPKYNSYFESLLSGYERIRTLPSDLVALANPMLAARLFGWLNHGCRHHDPKEVAEFLKWVPSTTQTIAMLCRGLHSDAHD